LTLADQIDAILPQTQCRRCGFEGCRPYAQALAAGESEINRCPPGGEAGVVRLAQLLGRTVQPIDPSCGDAQAPRLLARIIEDQCIGCTLCIQACPVDAILGAPKRMHTVVSAACTACELCVPPCPVDCIVLEPVPDDQLWTTEQASEARARHQARQARLARRELERARERIAHGKQKLAELDAESGPGTPAETAAPSGSVPAPDSALESGSDDARNRKRAIIEAAIRRARERLGETHGSNRPGAAS